jgi:hypothetical protein
MSYYHLKSHTGGGGYNKYNDYISNNISEIIQYLINDAQDFYGYFDYGTDIELKLKDINHNILSEIVILKDVKDFVSPYLTFTNNIQPSDDELDFIPDDFESPGDYAEYIDDRKLELTAVIEEYDVMTLFDGKIKITATKLDVFLILDIPKLLTDINEKMMITHDLPQNFGDRLHYGENSDA